MKGATVTVCADEAVDAARNRATLFEPVAARAGVSERSSAHFAARRSAADVEADVASDGSYAVVEWLDRNLPGIIENYTPTMTDRDFKRKVRAAV